MAIISSKPSTDRFFDFVSRFLTRFATCFGILWLIVEPVSSLGLLPMSLFAYFTLVMLALFITGVYTAAKNSSAKTRQENKSVFADVLPLSIDTAFSSSFLFLSPKVTGAEKSAELAKFPPKWLVKCLPPEQQADFIVRYTRTQKTQKIRAFWLIVVKIWKLPSYALIWLLHKVQGFQRNGST